MPKEIREKDVNYGFTPVEALPEPDSTGGARSRVQELVAQVKEAVEAGSVKPGQPVVVARYGAPTAASAAANVLRKKFGDDAKPYGFTFAVRKVKDGDDVRRGLFVQYDPSAIVAGEAAKQDAKWRAHQDHLADLRRKNEAKKASAAKKAS